MITPPQFRYFLEVARAGSIRAAADRLHIAPSAVSRKIRQLERDLGARLLERRARGVILTEAGTVYARYALDAVHSLQRVQSELELLRGLQRGHIGIAAVEGVIADLLAPVVAQFRRKFSGITFSITVRGTDEVARAVRDGNTDIGLAFYAEPHENLQFVERSPDPICAVLAPDHPLALRTSLYLTEVMSEPLAIPVSSFGIRHMIDAECQNLSRQISPVLETNSIETMRGFARDGAGITFLTRISVWRDLSAGRLVAVPMSDASFRKATIDLIVMAGRDLPLAAGEFVDFLRGKMVRLAHQRSAIP
ncbi:MAG: LysR family transcriptional regulator [Hyphomicrobiales bacterium]|nr:LysR family transcriptional regulator [Hyphomicrobiales bacterium]